MSIPDDQATTLETWAEQHELEATEAALSGRTPLLRTGLSDTVVDAQAGDLNGRSSVLGELVIASSGMFEGLGVLGVSDVDSIMFTVLVADVDGLGWGRLTIHPVNVPEEDAFTRIFDHQDHRVRHIDGAFDHRYRVRVARAIPDEQVRELFDAEFIAWCLAQEELLIEVEQSEEYGGALLVAHSDVDLSADQLDVLSEQSAYLIDRLGV
jgi:hypothetical protein